MAVVVQFLSVLLCFMSLCVICSYVVFMSFCHTVHFDEVLFRIQYFVICCRIIKEGEVFNSYP